MNKNTNQLYTYVCKKWLSKDHDDGSTERILVESNYAPDSPGRSSKLEIEVKDEEEEKVVEVACEESEPKQTAEDLIIQGNLNLKT